MDQITSALIGFISSIPIWGVIGFFAIRNMKKRDDFEQQTYKEFESIKIALAALDKMLAVIAKDIEHASNLTKTVGELGERVSKLKYDIDNYFNRIRDIESRVDV